MGAQWGPLVALIRMVIKSTTKRFEKLNVCVNKLQIATL
jgi:hypothetical protein